MLDFNAIARALAVAVPPAIIAFVLLVALDNLLGIANAVKGKSFDLHKLGSFLESQLGTKRLVVVISAAGVAVIAALLPNLNKPLSDIIHAVQDAALAALLAGVGANAAAVADDCRLKLLALLGSPAKA